VTYIVSDDSGELGRFCFWHDHNGLLYITQSIQGRQGDDPGRAARWCAFARFVDERRKLRLQVIEIERKRDGSKDDKSRKRPGNPGLTHDELIYRLAKAQEAEEISKNDQEKQWAEIALDIKWDKGAREQGLALLRDARHRLKRLALDDPLLAEVAEYRARGTKAMQDPLFRSPRLW
jgi:hypothetical protein